MKHSQKKGGSFEEEKKSLDALLNFIKYVCEVISFWKIFCKHQLHVLLRQFPVKRCKLTETCITPTLYRNEDAVSVTEILKLSKNCVTEDEKHERFLKALELCIQTVPKLPLVNI